MADGDPEQGPAVEVDQIPVRRIVRAPQVCAEFLRRQIAQHRHVGGAIGPDQPGQLVEGQPHEPRFPAAHVGLVEQAFLVATADAHGPEQVDGGGRAAKSAVDLVLDRVRVGSRHGQLPCLFQQRRALVVRRRGNGIDRHRRALAGGHQNAKQK